jgi:hypothetical protein
MSKNSFIFYAYDLENIYNLFEKSGGDRKDILAIYFAQNELIDDTHIKINHTKCMMRVNNILKIVPHSMVNDPKDISIVLSDINKFSQYKIMTSSGLNINFQLDNTTFAYSVAISIILITSFIINMINYQNQLEILKQNVNDKIVENKLPSTSMQLNILDDKYTKIIKEQLKYRDGLKRY